MTTHSQTHATFVLERVYPVPIERVWEAFADPEIKRQWFGSPDFMEQERREDFRVGGVAIHDGRRHRTGPLSQFRATYTDIVPHERIIYTYDMWLDGVHASTSITTNAASGKKLPYDLAKDLQPIGEVGAGPFVVVVNNDFKAKTLKEFIDLARAKPGSISYGTAGIGGINHLGTELFASAAKIELVHVPYKGIGPAFTDLMGGSLQMALPTVSSAVAYIQSGKMRGLSVTGVERSPLAPELPTCSDAGLPGFQLEVWWGILGPAKMPPAVLKRLNDELNAVLTQPEVRDVLAREGATPKPGTPEEFGKLIPFELARWSKLIKDAHIPTE